MALLNASAADLRPVHAELYAAMGSGTYTPLVAEEIPLAEAAKAHEKVMAEHAPGNIVLIP